ncbi:MAG: hypothetical protein ACXV2H_00330 [Actinomycetes bacterium]
MSGLEWILGFALAVLYFACLFFLGVRTFQRGYLVLGLVGIFLPFLWLIGAFLPDKRAPHIQ